MKQEMKKVLSLVLVLAMVLSVCNFVFAKSEYALPIDNIQEEEVLHAPPIAEYGAETVLAWPKATQADLSRAIVNPEAKGTIEYTVTGNAAILRATATPGVYDLTGNLNIGGDPAIVTAAYYSPGKSSANGDEPRFTTTTRVYVKPESEDYAVFDGYDVFDLSEMTYEMDEAFVLPYYSIASERETYGIIDLGMTEQWKNATVTFSNSAKFEYLGDGRIRALASHTWTDAGGRQGAVDSATTVRTFADKGDLTSKRDQMSMGTPVVMTVTAPDGGVKKFGLWAFPTTVQAAGTDPNAYKVNFSTNTISNAVVGVEVYDTAGNFVPTYKDPNTSYTYIPHADHRYTNTHAQPRMGADGWIYLPTSKANYWNQWASNQEYPGWIGVAQTFTAPKDGIICLTGYFPADGRPQYSADCTQRMISENQFFNLSVGLYDTDGTLISKVWQQKYGSKDPAATAWGRMDTPIVDTNRATLIDNENETLCVDLKKGQKLRVMIDLNLNWNPNYISFGGDYAIKPVWTYYEETFTEPPMAAYDAETVLPYPHVTQVDLTCAIVNPDALGHMEYTVTGNPDVLRATATPGVYLLTGERNDGGEPAIVTAAYYSPFKSSAKGDSPRFTTSTKVYVSPASLGVATFTMAPNFKTSGLGLDFDSYQLPYYSNATERAMYGEIDLGFTEEWKNATVTFDVAGKFEYLGNGRIRAIARHNYVDAGKRAVDATDTYTTGKNYLLKAYRDTNTIGKPVVMTVTAPDGGVKKFGLWSFDAQVQSAAGNSYTFSTATPFANDVVAMEAVVADGTFKKMLPDSAATSDVLVPTADVKFEQIRSTLRLTNGGWQFGDPSEWYWKDYVAHPDFPYVDYDGFSTAFTAPKDGNLTVSTFWPVLGEKGHGSTSLVNTILSNPLSHEIRVYNADGTYETKYTVVYAADKNTSNLCLLNTITSKTLGTNATFDDKETADIADDTVTFDVKKGQIVRVMLTTKAANIGNSVGVYQKNLPFPTFTYNQTTVDAMGSTIVATPVVGNTTLASDNVLALVYDATGALVQVAKDEAVTVENGKVSVNVTAANAAYAKLFFWDSLENIRPISSDIVVRK